MIRNISHILFLAAFVLGVNVIDLNAQDEASGVEFEDILITKDREIVLPKAEKMYVNPPKAGDEDKEKQDFVYDLGMSNYQKRLLEPTLKVLKIKNEENKTGYRNYAQVGLGNFATHHVDLFMGLVQQKDKHAYFRVGELSGMRGPVDKGNSADSHIWVDLGAGINKFGQEGKANIKYNRDAYRFYGYPDTADVSEDAIKQVFNRFSVNADFDLLQKSSLWYASLGFDLNYLNDKFDASELTFFIPGKVYYQVKEDIKAGFDLDFTFRNYTSGNSINRNVTRFYPNVEYILDDLSLTGGVRLGFQNDTLSGNSNTRVFLVAQASYQLTDFLRLYAGIDGNIEDNGFNNLTIENPYLNTLQPIINTINTFEFNGGVKGKAGSSLSYDLGIRWKNFDNFHTFLNDTTDISRFNVVYDGGNTSLINIYGQFDYSFSEKVILEAATRYYNYNTKTLAEAWHKPQWINKVGLRYIANKKLGFYGEFNHQSGILALNEVGETVTLDPIIDINLKTDYNISDQAVAWIGLYNIANKNYQYYYRYPVRGLQVFLGFRYSF